MQRYKSNEVRRHKFIQVPKELYHNKRYKHISNDAKVLYGFLLDRLELSEKNNWVNENNEIYLIFTRSEVQQLINISSKTSTKIFKELKEVGLIYEQRQGLKKPNIIYVGHIIYDSDENIDESLMRKNYASKYVKSTVQETEKLPLTNTNITNTNFINKEEDNTNKVKISKNILDIYREAISANISSLEYIELTNLQNKYNEELLSEAIIISVKNNKKNLAYIEVVLKDWWMKGYRTSEDIKAHIEKWKDQNRKKNNNKKARVSEKPKLRFNNFKGRDYDYDDLERKLLGWDKED